MPLTASTIKTNPRDIISPEAKNVLQKYISKIPRFLMGPDRVSFLMEQFKEMDNEERFHLMEVMNNLLKVMTDMEASDIELGGYGTEGLCMV